MAIYFKCPHCGAQIMDMQGEYCLDYDKGIYECPECGGEMDLDNTIEDEEFCKKG